jgi:hypothetical protein
MSDRRGLLPAATAVLPVEVVANAHNFFGMKGTLKGGLSGIAAANVASGGVLLPSVAIACVRFRKAN